MVDLRPCGLRSRCRLELRSVVGIHLAPQMTVLVLARGALEGSDRPKNAICLKSASPAGGGKRKSVAASIVAVFTSLSGKSRSECWPINQHSSSQHITRAD